MNSHYFKLAWKALSKNKYYALINVFGLVAGMLGALVIGKYIGGSLELDSFHSQRNNIYSIDTQEFVGNEAQPTRVGTYAVVSEVITQFPEVVCATRYSYHVESLVIGKSEQGDLESYTENAIFITDSSFFKVFSFPMVFGNARTALSKLNSVVLTQATARKYFGERDPVGQALSVRTSWGDERLYQVTAVVQNPPALSRFKFDFLVTQPVLNPDDLWIMPNSLTFALLKPQASGSTLSEKTSSLLRNIPQLKSASKTVTLSMRSLADVSLSTTEYLLVTIGILIIIISWANYINQNIAQAYSRTKQIGVLKVLGASSVDLRLQFIIEASMICAAACLITVGMYIVLEPLLQSFTNSHLIPLSSDAANINSFFLLIFLLGTALSASAPIVVFARQKLEETLRTNFNPKVAGIGIRKVLVTLQFSVSAVLMVCVFVVSQQLKYLSMTDKGFAMEKVLIIKAAMSRDTTWHVKKKTFETFKDQVAALPFVTGITSSTTVPSEEYRHETYLSVEGRDDKVLMHQNGIDENFFSLYEVPFAAGNDFIPNANAKNRASIILNESAARALGYSDFNTIINTRLIDHEGPDLSFEIVGVIKDYHQTSLKYETRPLAFKYNVFRGHCSVKLNPQFVEGSTNDQMLASIEAIWKQSYPDASFDYFYLTDKFQEQDQEDQYFGLLFQSFTILSIILSCLGLFGLSILITTKRQKEVGIRKTFGARPINILIVFIKSYLGPLSVSLVVGCLSAYLLMNAWLMNYANRIDIGVGLISSASLSLIAIFIGAISYETIRVAMINPVKVLRNQ